MTSARQRWCGQPAGWGLLGTDALLLFVGLVLACVGRYDGALHRIDTEGLLVGVTVLVVAYTVIATALRLHGGRHPVGSADEVGALAAALTGSALVLFAATLTSGSPRLMPLSVPMLGAVISLLLMLAVRLVLRRQREEAVRPRGGARTLIFGAGAGGTQLTRAMLQDPDSPYLPVGLLDDDRRKRHARINGIRTLGGREELAAATASTKADVLIIAMPSVDADLVRDLYRRGLAAGLAVKVLPPIIERLAPRVGVGDVRDLDIADLLGRRQIDTHVDAIAGYLVGRRVLVTGAGGSIGSELCVQIAGYRPAELIMLDRDESALHAVQLRLHGRAQLDAPDVVLADIRDAESIEQIFTRRRPEVVFHAAALKHVTMLEQYPDEAWKTNVLGTRNVLQAATAVGVAQFINVSTDKAADPVSVLGRTKRLGEQLTAAYAARNIGAFLSVRFGNVLGSRGSVLATFAAQIAAGGPVTVTHPDVTRYFMTVPEAVQLVIQAGAIGRDGEALVLDMGRPVRIAEVARQLIELSDRTIPVVYTGLRPGEKLHEDLLGVGESGIRRVHPLIEHVAVPPVDDWVLANIDRRGTDMQRMRFLLDGAATAHTAEENAR
jgi:FlaA1/EpsC-like NDP-sugar epimerase